MGPPVRFERFGDLGGDRCLEVGLVAVVAGDRYGRRGQDDLQRGLLAYGVDGAQDLVARDDLAESRGERVAAEIPLQLVAERDGVVRLLGAAELIDEPKALLSEGKRLALLVARLRAEQGGSADDAVVQQRAEGLLPALELCAERGGERGSWSGDAEGGAVGMQGETAGGHVPQELDIGHGGVGVVCCGRCSLIV